MEQNEIIKLIFQNILTHQPMPFAYYRTTVEVPPKFSIYGHHTPEKKNFVRSSGWNFTLAEFALDFTEEQIDTIMQEWSQIEETNKQAVKNNQQGFAAARGLLVALLNQMGLKAETTTYTARMKSKTVQSPAFRKLVDDLREKYTLNRLPQEKPRVNAYEIGGEVYQMNRSPITLKDVWAEGRAKRERLIEQERKSNALLVACVQYAQQHQISLEGLLNNQIVATVHEHAREAWQAEQYPDGTEMEISCCSECSQWTVGDRRCSCGNRRVSLTVEGNLVDGFYAYAEAY